MNSNASLKKARASVAVVLPTYNRERFLPSVLSSIVKQTVLPSQLVVVIDGSTDGSRQLIESFARDAPLKVDICNNRKNLGIGFSRQAGADRVMEDVDYVAYISDDDSWRPDFLERMLTRSTPDRITYCYYQTANQLASRRPLAIKFPTSNSREEFLRAVVSSAPDMFVNFSCLLIPRAILRRVRFHEEFRKGEDLAFLLDSLLSGVEYQCLEEPLVTIGVHREQVSVNWEVDERRTLLKYVAERLRELGVPRDLVLPGMQDAIAWTGVTQVVPERIWRSMTRLFGPSVVGSFVRYAVSLKLAKKNRSLKRRLEATRFST